MLVGLDVNIRRSGHRGVLQDAIQKGSRSGIGARTRRHRRGAALLLGGLAQDLEQVAAVEKMSPEDGVFRGQVRGNAKAGLTLQLGDHPPIARIGHRHRERAAARVERDERMRAGVVLAHPLESLRLDVGHLEVRKREAPVLRELFQQKSHRYAAAFAQRALQRQTLACGEPRGRREIFRCHDVKAVDQQFTEFGFSDAHARDHSDFDPSARSTAAASSTSERFTLTRYSAAPASSVACLSVS